MSVVTSSVVRGARAGHRATDFELPGNRAALVWTANATDHSKTNAHLPLRERAKTVTLPNRRSQAVHSSADLPVRPTASARVRSAETDEEFRPGLRSDRTPP